MNRFFMTMASMASLLSCSTVSAFWPEAADSSFEVGIGYRNDKLSNRTVVAPGSSRGSSSESYSSGSSFFSSSGESSGSSSDGFDIRERSNVSSGPGAELKWNDLNIWQIGANFKYLTCDDIYVRGMIDYGWITNGGYKLVDYAESTTETFSNLQETSSGFITSAGDSNKQRGHVYDASIALGYQFRMCDDTLAITPLIGYAWNGQHLNTKKHNGSSDYSYTTETITLIDTTITTTETFTETTTETETATETTGSSSGVSALSSNQFHAKWNGVWIGFDVDYKFMCDWAVFGSYEYHWSNYQAKGHLDTFGQLSNRFRQSSKDAHGQNLQIGLRWDFCDCWTASLVGDWKWYNANEGKTKSFVSGESLNEDLKVRTYTYSPVKNVKWQSAGVTLNVGMLF